MRQQASHGRRRARAASAPAPSATGNARGDDPRLEPRLHRRLGRQRRLPAIERDLASSGASGASIGWLINAYLLPLGALVLFGGVAGDRWGRKRTFLAGMLVFTLASIGCAAGAGLRLAARRPRRSKASARLCSCRPAWRSLGAAFSGEARGRAVGTWAAAERDHRRARPARRRLARRHVGWRAIFLVNLPVAAIAAVALVAQASRRAEATTRRRSTSRARLSRPPVSALATFGLTLLAGHGLPRRSAPRCARRRRRARCRSARADRVRRRRSTPRPARDDAARAVRHQRLRRRDVADALPLCRARAACSCCCRTC